MTFSFPRPQEPIVQPRAGRRSPTQARCSWPPGQSVAANLTSASDWVITPEGGSPGESFTSEGISPPSDAAIDCSSSSRAPNEMLSSASGWNLLTHPETRPGDTNMLRNEAHGIHLPETLPLYPTYRPQCSPPRAHTQR